MKKVPNGTMKIAVKKFCETNFVGGVVLVTATGFFAEVEYIRYFKKLKLILKK